MTIKKHVQLIDKIDIPEGVILNLWDMNARTQISVEIDKPTGEYAVGEVFVIDTTEKREDLAFERSNAPIDPKLLLIPRKSATGVSGSPRKFVIKKRSRATEHKIVQQSYRVRALEPKQYTHPSKKRFAAGTKSDILKLIKTKVTRRKSGSHTATEAAKKTIFSGSVIK
jgi:hypothetical protein